MTYKLSHKSKLKLTNVHPDLVKCVKRAITLTKVDFCVLEGCRSTERQQALYAAGASQIDGVKKRGKHQEDARTGYGHAVDLGAYIGGQVRWEFRPYFDIARAMQLAGREFGVKLRWGGCWVYLNGAEKTLEKLVDEYVERKKAIGRSAFLDGPHFELDGRGIK